jgi:poly(A) polymerase
MEDDAARRDFTINALYYDPAREEVHDYFGGVADCRKRVLRMIGNPETRFREDPVRMLRAARFAAKLDFHIDPDTRRPVATLAPLLANIPRARIFDEALKLLLSGHALRGVHQLRAEGLHHGMLPLLDTILDDPTGERFITAALKSTDERIQSDRPSSPAFLFGTLLWPQVLQRWRALEAAGEKPMPALFLAMDEVLDAQRGQLAIPRRYDGMMKEVWGLQPRFEQRGGQRPFRLMEHPRFRAAYDFLLLRAESGEVEAELADWWTRFQDAGEDERAAMLVADNSPKPRRRRKRRKPADGDAASEASPA